MVRSLRESRGLGNISSSLPPDTGSLDPLIPLWLKRLNEIFRLNSSVFSLIPELNDNRYGLISMGPVSDLISSDSCFSVM